MTHQFSVPECLGAIHSTESSISEERASMHGTTSLLVPGIFDRADDSVTTSRKLEAVSVVDMEARACFCKIATK